MAAAAVLEARYDSLGEAKIRMEAKRQAFQELAESARQMEEELLSTYQDDADSAETIHRVRALAHMAGAAVGGVVSKTAKTAMDCVGVKRPADILTLLDQVGAAADAAFKNDFGEAFEAAAQCGANLVDSTLGSLFGILSAYDDVVEEREGLETGLGEYWNEVRSQVARLRRQARDAESTARELSVLVGELENAAEIGTSSCDWHLAPDPG